MQEKKLGRGLDFLLNKTSSEVTKEKKVEEVNITSIRKNRFQPRDTIEDEALQDLMASIKENGILQPVLIRKDGSYFELIAGERRLKACLALGKKTIPAITLDVPENRLLQLALIENIQRENLNAIEEARAYRAMQKLENITHEELSKRVGKKRSTITNTLRLLDLPDEIQENVSRGTISQGHARALLCFESKKEMLDAFNRTIKNNLSVRELENLTKQSKKISQKKRKENAPARDSNIKSFEESLKNRFGTKVDISARGDKGVIQIHYFSKDDFSRLYFNLMNSSD
jgi:ParB family chromosome partitioning protein